MCLVLYHSVYYYFLNKFNATLLQFQWQQVKDDKSLEMKTNKLHAILITCSTRKSDIKSNEKCGENRKEMSHDMLY